MAREQMEAVVASRVEAWIETELPIYKFTVAESRLPRGGVD